MNFFLALKNYLFFLKIKKNIKKKIICFYSESKNYRNYFEDIVNKIKYSEKYQVFYFTSDEDDVDKFKSGTKPIFIGSGLIRIIFFTFLKCEIMIMTLTDLGNHELKKSKFCKYYIYFFHSLCSTFKSYTKKAFDNYDIIFASGQYQIDEIKKNENIYKLKKKIFYNTGYFYLENLKKKIKQNISDGSVLFAPSWSNSKKNDLLEIFGKKIIKNLLEKNKVYFRPHPQSLVSSKNSIKEILKYFTGYQNFFFNSETIDLEPLNKSSILLTDNGGMCMEYYILYNRPFIYINFKEKIHNLDFNKFSQNTIEEKFKIEFGKKIDVINLDKINTFIDYEIKNFNFDAKKLEVFLNLHKINYENSVNHAYEKIELITNDI